MYDVECPYCGSQQEINHDDGYGYDEDVVFSQECTECEKTFVYTTSIIYNHSAAKAPCLNGSDHKYKPTITTPKECTRMRCVWCDDERRCTAEEMENILKG